MTIDKFIDWTTQGISPDEDPTEDACTALATGFFDVQAVRELVAEIQALRG